MVEQEIERKIEDFIAVDSNGYPAVAVQVCMDLSQPDTIKRELEPIIATARYFQIKENYIVTYNQEQDFHEEGISVKAIPAWKWMLNPA